MRDVVLLAVGAMTNCVFRGDDGQDSGVDQADDGNNPSVDNNADHDNNNDHNGNDADNNNIGVAEVVPVQ